MSAWLYLMIASLLEMSWPIGMTYTEGLRRLWPSVFAIVVSILSFLFLSQAVRPGGIPAGTGYAIWSGCGAIGTAILGVLLLGEPVTLARFLSLALIVAGIIGLRLTTPVVE